MDHNKYMRARTVYEFKPDNFVIGGLYRVISEPDIMDTCDDFGFLEEVTPDVITFNFVYEDMSMRPVSFTISKEDADQYEIIQLVENPVSFDEYEYKLLCTIIHEAMEARENISYLATDKEVFCRIRDKVKRLTVFTKNEFEEFIQDFSEEPIAEMREIKEGFLNERK